jgi:excisionase family DNA binding protein
MPYIKSYKNSRLSSWSLMAFPLLNLSAMEFEKEQELKNSGFWGVQDLSNYLGIKTSTLYAWVGEKKIPHYKVGQLVRFKRSEIDLWMEQNQVKCVDPEKMAKKALGPIKRPKLDVERIIRKAIDQAKREGYTTPHGKPDQVKGLGKEVLNGTL